MARVLLTQPDPRVRRLAEALIARGHEACALPMRQLVPFAHGGTWARDLALRHDWVVFVSPGAIEIALERFVGPWPTSVGIGLIGPGSAAELRRHPCVGPGVHMVQPSTAPFDADGLLGVAPFDAPAGLRVLVLRGATGRNDWLDTLRERGATVELLALYETRTVPHDPQAWARLAQWAEGDLPVHFVVTSVEGVAQLEIALAGRGLSSWARSQPVLTQHVNIARALRAHGWANVRQIAPGDEGLYAGIESAAE